MKVVFENEIQRHIYSIPSLVQRHARQALFDVFQQAEIIDRAKIKLILLTGCGYSYAACLAAQQALSISSGLPVLVMPAIEISRFTEINSNMLVVGVSGSGQVSRILEAMTRAHTHGATVVGLTAAENSDMRCEADLLLNTSTPDIGSSLPLRGYASALLTLLFLGYAISIRDVSHPLAAPLRLLDGLFTSMDRLGKMLPSIDDCIRNFSYNHQNLRCFEFIGSGYERAAAFLGKIQMMGQAGLFAVDEDPEQWLHCNFFMSNPQEIGTVLFLSKNSPAFSRGREAMDYMLHLGRPLCLVTDESSLVTNTDIQLITVPSVTVQNAGLVQMVVPSLLSGYYCDLTGETYSRGFRPPWDIFRDGRGTCRSLQIIL